MHSSGPHALSLAPAPALQTPTHTHTPTPNLGWAQATAGPGPTLPSTLSTPALRRDDGYNSGPHSYRHGHEPHPHPHPHPHLVRPLPHEAWPEGRNDRGPRQIARDRDGEDRDRDSASDRGRLREREKLAEAQAGRVLRGGAAGASGGAHAGTHSQLSPRSRPAARALSTADPAGNLWDRAGPVYDVPQSAGPARGGGEWPRRVEVGDGDGERASRPAGDGLPREYFGRGRSAFVAGSSLGGGGGGARGGGGRALEPEFRDRLGERMRLGSAAEDRFSTGTLPYPQAQDRSREVGGDRARNGNAVVIGSGSLLTGKPREFEGGSSFSRAGRDRVSPPPPPPHRPESFSPPRASRQSEHSYLSRGPEAERVPHPSLQRDQINLASGYALREQHAFSRHREGARDSQGEQGRAASARRDEFAHVDNRLVDYQRGAPWEMDRDWERQRDRGAERDRERDRERGRESDRERGRERDRERESGRDFRDRDRRR